MSNPDNKKSLILIAHALGAVDGFTYTNSDAAFRHSVESGFRFLEADLALTRDQKVVLYHHKKPEIESEAGWRDKKAYQLSWDELCHKKYMGRYPVLDLEGFLNLAIEYPETKIILDIKTVNKSRVFRARRDNEISFANSLVLKFYRKKGKEIGAAAGRLFDLLSWTTSNRIHPHEQIIEKLMSLCEKKVLDRLIPQVGRDSVEALDGLYPFPMKIWKPTGESMERAFVLAEDKGCRYISLHESGVSAHEIRLSRRHNVDILVYGLDSADRIGKLISEGVGGFYLDSMGDIG